MWDIRMNIVLLLLLYRKSVKDRFKKCQQQQKQYEKPAYEQSLCFSYVLKTNHRHDDTK